ncbi:MULTISPECIES: NADH-quinone oxidoreductase subunit NuoE [Tepidanaerobacter]|uniref:NADH-quinone oxidoreductase subunit E n=1 Tax=Tepidanaerobacter syntrophicus TaxID=224999 RepID=A0A0U9HIY7_9FIRM|nr:MULTISPECIES: NADH-quinone oxidoreductase subunit NuoE [Tepidanaerobacter]GAQ25860.1 NADH-quinone oxidoreductase subunit E [Tepidanaerobacter syntrophicus]GLI19407.1 NADH dehydrogenase [Tepidanaerobacter syntrophicus]GLI50515.1 NADH dehydrogenase [Tepidanaerobacter syntrophicus]HHV82789.1 NADH-quinone oxidoreductase subunit NuoE [Tepidanaerobacter syntrophicus]
MSVVLNQQQEFAEKLKQVEVMLEKYKGKRGTLLQALQEAQNIVGYLPMEVQKMVSEALNITLSEVYSTVTFYSFFSLKPKGKYQIRTCLGTACYVRGAEKVLDRLKTELGIDVGDTTDDGKFSLNSCRCIGACGLAPAMIINDEVYGRMTPDKVPDILKRFE